MPQGHLRWGAEGLWQALSPLMPGLSVEVLPSIGSTNSELLARVRALIRRSRAGASLVLAVGPLTLDAQRHSATLGNEALELTGREWNVLEQLVLAVPKVVAKQKLADSLSQWDKEITPNAVEIYISRLRGKLVGSGVNIRTVRGIGYRIEAEAPDAPAR